MLIRLLPICLVFATHVPLAAAAAAVFDFTSDPAPTMFKAEERGVSSSIDAGQLVLHWQAKHAGFHEAYFARAAELPGPGALVLQVKRSGGVPLWTLSARIRDAKGEVFNFTSRIPESGGELRITVQEGKHDGHWGGDPGTGTMQAPLALIGIAVNGGSDPGTATLSIAPILFEAAKP
jgi:hypothetical protein